MKKEMLKRIPRRLVIFFIFWSLNYIFDYVFRTSKIDLLREFSVSLGVALGISFFDFIFVKKNKN